MVAGNEITTTEVEVGDVEAEFTNIEESVIVAENTLEVSPEITAEDDSEINL